MGNDTEMRQSFPSPPAGFTIIPPPPPGFTVVGSESSGDLESIKAAQAAKYPTAAELGGKAGTIAPGIPETQNLQDLTIGVSPDILRDRLMGAIASLTNTILPAGDVRRPDEYALPPLTPEEEVGAKVMAVASASGLGDSLIRAGVNGIMKQLPSTTRAAIKFDEIAAAANKIPIETSEASSIAGRANELRSRGSSMPKVIRDFLNNRKLATDPLTGVQEPMVYAEGRDFASNAGALSTREVTAMNAKMQRQVAQFATAMKDANREAAVKVGMGELYDAAMKEYAQAKTLAAAGEVLKKWGARALIAAGLGASGAAGYRFMKELANAR